MLSGCNEVYEAFLVSGLPPVQMCLLITTLCQLSHFLDGTWNLLQNVYVYVQYAFLCFVVVVLAPAPLVRHY